MNEATQTNHAQNVATANAALEEVSGFLENVTDDDDASTDVIPNTDTCVDTDNGAEDLFGDNCSDYTRNPAWCGTWFDTDEFTANEMCCTCKARLAN